MKLKYKTLITNIKFFRMKKIYKMLCLAIAGIIGLGASAQDVTWTLTPAAGTYHSLPQEFVLTVGGCESLAGGWSGVPALIMTGAGQTVAYDGNIVTGTTTVKYVPAEKPISGQVGANADFAKEGTYTGTIVAGSIVQKIMATTSDGSVTNPALTFGPYEVSAAVEVGLFDDYTVTPTQGTVEELETIVVTFPNADDLEIQNRDGITVNYNGVDVRKSVTYSGNKLTIKLTEKATVAGTVEVLIPAESITAYGDPDEEGSFSKEVDLDQDITLSYTIEGSAVTPAVSFEDWTVTPAAGEVKELSKIEFTFPNAAELDIVTADDITVTLGETVLESTASYTGNKLTVTLATAQTAGGEYKVTIAADAISAYGGEDEEGSYTEYLDLPEAIEVTYTIKEVLPVVYDITVTKILPAVGELDFNERDLENLTLTFSQPISVKEGAEATLTHASGKVLTAPLVKSIYSLYQVSLNFKAATLNGEWTLNVPEGVVGDEEWINNPEIGHANAAYTAVYTFINGTSTATYDLTMTVDPATGSTINCADNKKPAFTLTLPAGTQYANKAIYLGNTVLRYNFPVDVKAGANDGEFVLTASQDLAYNGEYQLTIPVGAFGDADFIAGNEGHANAAVVYTYKATGLEDLGGEEVDLQAYTVTPDEDEEQTELSEIVLTFAESYPGKNEEARASVQLSDSEDEIVENTELSAATEGHKLTVKLTPAVSENGEYTLYIPMGVYYLYTTEAKDDAEPEMMQAATLTFTVKDGVGVSEVQKTAIEVESVYSISGVKLSNDVDALPAGLYIVNGKKTLIVK